MKNLRFSSLFAVVAWGGTGAIGAAAEGIAEYRGMCNASAAIAIGGDRFVVADDEDKPTTFLRVYKEGQLDAPLVRKELSAEALRLDKDEDLEVDLEGAARIGDRVYWIGSHSANKNGKDRPNRRRLFATTIDTTGAGIEVKVVDQPYKKLIKDLDSSSDYRQFQLKKAGEIAPKEPGGFSIEGLAATPEGELLIGFRNPIPKNKALIARLKNPGEVLRGKPAQFGAPIQLDLGGLGIRSMEWVDLLHGYLIVGGPAAGGGSSRVFRWSGDPMATPTPVLEGHLDGLNPEALFLEGERATFLSDDGGRVVDGEERDCSPSGMMRSFRGVSVKLAAPR